MQLLDGTVVPLGQNSRNLVSNALQGMSSGALRCLGFAYKDELPEFETYDGNDDHPAHDLLLDPSNYSSIESNLTFVGFVGLRVSYNVSITAFTYNAFNYIFFSAQLTLLGGAN